MAFVRATVELATIAAPVLLLALRRVAVVAVFSRFTIFALVWGLIFFLRNFCFYS